MKKIVILVILALIPLHNTFSFSKNRFYEAGKFNVEIMGSYIAGSSYYDLNKNVIVTNWFYGQDANGALDSIRILFDYRNYIFGFNLEYNILDNFKVYGSLPYAVYTLDEKFKNEETGVPVPKEFLSLSQPMYYKLGASYLYTLGGFYASGQLEALIPPGFHKGILDSTNKFLSDGAFQLLTGLNAGYDFKKYWLEASLLYFNRSEELVDQILYNFEGGISTVPDTYLWGDLYYMKSLESFANAVPFNVRKTPVQEEYLGLGFGFRIDFESNIHAEFNYKIKLDGKNTWKYGQFYLSAGVVL